MLYLPFNPNSQDNKGSWRILKDFYCSVTMLRELGLMNSNSNYNDSTLFWLILGDPLLDKLQEEREMAEGQVWS